MLRSAMCLMFAAAPALSGQAPVPILEWGPGLSVRSELILRNLGVAPLPSDIDHDGDMDFVCHVSWDGSVLVTILRNDGRGGFSVELVPPGFSRSLWAGGHAVGDIDGDDDDDIVKAGMWQASHGGADRPYVYLNDGAGNFTIDMTRFPQSPGLRAGPVLTDVDRDGDLDVLFISDPPWLGIGLEIWLNDGRGFFTDGTAGRVPAGIGSGDAMAAGDIDGDGAPEIVLGRSGRMYEIPPRVLWNDGTGHFTVQFLTPNRSVYSIHVRDVDGDGDHDLFLKGGQGRLYLNEGSRTLTEVPFPLTNFYDGPAAMGDINDDGYPDVIVTGTVREPWVLLNDGRGQFVEAPGWMHGPWRGGILTMVFADVDRDGDEDAFANGISPWSTGAVFFNLHRQVWGLPTAARGTTYQVEICGRVGTIFTVALSASRLSSPVALGRFGLWHLDPTSTVPLGISIMNVAGKGSIPLPVPDVPSLSNRTFYLEGFDFDTGTPLHATGWWPVRVQ